MEDLCWWGLEWDGEPVHQSERLELYKRALIEIARAGMVYRSDHTRKEIKSATREVSPVDGDPIFPTALRNPPITAAELEELFNQLDDKAVPIEKCPVLRIRVPDGRMISFHDNRTGQHSYMAGRDFGDFIAWRRDGIPSYELAVVVDDIEMQITEVVRGEDLLLSTARQLLLYEVLGQTCPQWYHCPLVNDPQTNQRMSKTHKSLALRELRARGLPPGQDPEFYFKHLNLAG